MSSLRVTVKNADLVISYKLLWIAARDELFELECFLHSIGLSLLIYLRNYSELTYGVCRLSDDNVSKINDLTDQLGKKTTKVLGISSFFRERELLKNSVLDCDKKGRITARIRITNTRI